MAQQKRGPARPPEDCGPALLGKQAGTAGAVSGEPPDRTILPYSGRTCQAPRNLAEVAQDAIKRAWAAGLLAECCGLIGDPLGRADWLRRRALHLSIYYSATHPQEVPA